MERYASIKYDTLDNQSDDFDNDYERDDVPLLSFEENDKIKINKTNKIKNNNCTDNIREDSDSVLLNLEENNNKQNNNKQIEYDNTDNTSRNIIRYFITSIIMTSSVFAILIFGGIDYKNTNYDNIIYGEYGVILFQYYYIINFCWYIIFFIISCYLILHIICNLSLKEPVREIAFFKFLRLNFLIFSINIITKILFGIFIMLLTDSDNSDNNNNNIRKIPKYYNYIIVEICMYMFINIFNTKFMHNLNWIIDIN